jgi:hypothetical protein
MLHVAEIYICNVLSSEVGNPSCPLLALGPRHFATYATL